jgi:hypothetical protein
MDLAVLIPAQLRDRPDAAFDKLRLRPDFSAITGSPHAELVEARTALDASTARSRYAYDIVLEICDGTC